MTLHIKKLTLGSVNIFSAMIKRAKKIKRVIPLLTLFLLYSCATKDIQDQKQSNAQTIPIIIASVDDWTERKFAGSTAYSLKTIKGKQALSANSNASASMLYKKVKIDLRKTPYLNWQWLIDNTITAEDGEQSRKGDDFPARVYIAIKPALLEIKPRALTYVWASTSPQFASWKNPYTNNVAMLALQSGKQKSQQWISEKRNLKQDLEQAFGEPVDFIEGIAVMSDSDNTKTTTNAAFSDLFFSVD